MEQLVIPIHLCLKPGTDGSVRLKYYLSCLYMGLVLFRLIVPAFMLAKIS